MLDKTLDDVYVFASRFDTTVSFWIENPDLAYISPYAELKESLGDEESAKIMEAVWMVYDPKSSANNSGARTESQVKKEVEKYYLKNEKFNWEEFESLIIHYKKHSRTPIEQDSYFYRRKLNELKAHLDRMQLSLDAESVTQLMRSYKQLLSDYAEIEALAKRERSESRLRGGAHRYRVERVASK